MLESLLRLHSWLTPKCHIQPSPLQGHGVFAREPIAARELVCVWGGVVYTAAEVETLSETFRTFRLTRLRSPRGSTGLDQPDSHR